MKSCEKGKFVGDIHVETVPHEPTFPSDDDIQNNLNRVRFEQYTEPWVSCLCSKVNQVAGHDKNMKRIIHACYCERWHPWKKEQNDKILEKAMPYAYLLSTAEEPGSNDPKRVGFFYLWEDLLDMDFITDRQIQFSHTHIRKFPRKDVEKTLKSEHRLLNKDEGKENLDAIHKAWVGTPWRSLERHDKYWKD
jgi:hypothetical protein